MADNNRKNLLHHRGRAFQVPIYLGKQFRSFIFMNDWKMIPMAAVIAALVSMVIRRRFLTTMEGTLMGAFALTCVALWNGCFNSIQVICRERSIIKREHRSGMHISSYMLSNMIYQAALCLAQTAVSMYVFSVAGVKVTGQGFMTPWMIVDLGITIFLISYASDMLSLLVSSIAHSTTAAMTVMPFVLIFQLVFSGGIFTNMPEWAQKCSAVTISNYGLTCITTQADYNNREVRTGWTTLEKVQNEKIEGTITVGQILDLASTETGVVKKLRTQEITVYKPEWLKQSFSQLLNTAGLPKEVNEAMEGLVDETIAETVGTEPVKLKLGEMIDLLIEASESSKIRDKAISYSFTVSDILDCFDRKQLEEYVVSATTKAMYNPAYERTTERVVDCWMTMIGFSLLFAALATISLEFIDKDKR